MTYTSSHGPPELDATHAWNPTGTDPPTINSYNSAGWIKLDAVQGWRSLPETEDLRAPSTLSTGGEIIYPTRLLGKTLVYECRVMARTRESMRALLHSTLQGYGLSVSVEGVMTVTPFATPGGIAYTFSARTIDLQADRSFTSNDRRAWTLQWGFTISLRMSDPHFYSSGTPYL